MTSLTPDESRRLLAQDLFDASEGRGFSDDIASLHAHTGGGHDFPPRQRIEVTTLSKIPIWSTVIALPRLRRSRRRGENHDAGSDSSPV
jgi:hypothetical protein